MSLPLVISFRNVDATPALEAAIRERAARLGPHADRIVGCHVVVEAPHRHHQHGTRYHVRIDLTIPGREIVASRDAGETRSHEDVYVAIHDAFDTARR
jgi:ribosomal subunit interface protein